MNLQTLLDEDRRQTILRILRDSPDYALNEDLIIRALKHLRLGVPGFDVMRGHLAWLEQNGLVKLERLEVQGQQLWVATATRLGIEVAEGRLYPGVARPAPG